MFDSHRICMNKPHEIMIKHNNQNECLILANIDIIIVILTHANLSNYCRVQHSTVQIVQPLD